LMFLFGLNPLIKCSYNSKIRFEKLTVEMGLLTFFKHYSLFETE
jgi:hypothetical protein